MKVSPVENNFCRLGEVSGNAPVPTGISFCPRMSCIYLVPCRRVTAKEQHDAEERRSERNDFEIF
jgi:hypothetical protein